MGPSWAEVGASLVEERPQVEPMLRPCRIKKVHWTMLRRYAKLPQSRARFRGLSRANMGPPSVEAAPVTRGLFESISSILNFHPSAPPLRADFFESSLDENIVRRPQTVWGIGINEANTSNSGYGTETDQVWTSSQLKQQDYVYIYIYIKNIYIY